MLHQNAFFSPAKFNYDHKGKKNLKKENSNDEKTHDKCFISTDLRIR